jgi:Ca2+/Na+ antiporter
LKSSVANGLVATGIAAPVLAFFTGHAPPYYRELSVFITPTLGLLSLAIIRQVPKRATIALILSILCIAGAIVLLAIYFQELREWTVPNPAHPTIRYQVGPIDSACLTSDGQVIKKAQPNDTPAQWLRPGGYSEDNVANIWTRDCRAKAGQQMLFIYVFAVILWVGGNELLKKTTPDASTKQESKAAVPDDAAAADAGSGDQASCQMRI